MKITEITLKNFFRYGNSEQKVRLDTTGITAVTAPNGYGKSTLLIDSILFCFFAKYRTDTIDDVVNRYTGKDCKVGVEFVQDGHTYKVIRYRKHSTQNNNVFIFEDGKDVSGHTVTETNNKIIDTIKFNYVSFTNSTVFSTELYSAFLENKNSERLVVFENILSLKEVTQFYVETNKIIKEIENRLEDKNNEKNILLSKKSTIQSTVTAYSSNAKTKLLNIKENIQETNKLKEEAETKIKELQIVDVEKEKNKLSNSATKKELEERVRKLESDKSLLTISEPAEEMFIVDKYKDIDFESNKLKELKYKEDLETISMRENGMKLAIQKIDSLKKELGSLEEKEKTHRFTVIELNDKIFSLKSSICPFCKQHMETEAASKEIENAQIKLNQIKDEDEEITEKLETAKKELEEEQENYNWFVTDINSIKSRINKDFIPNSDLVEEKYKNAIAKLAEVKKQKEQNEIKLLEINKEISEIRDRLSGIEITNWTEEELDNIAKNISNLKDAIISYNSKIAALNASAKEALDINYINSLKKEIEGAEAEIVSKDKEIEEINDELKHYSFLAEKFSNKSSGFKKHFIGQMIDLFNEKVNQFLPFFFNEKVSIVFDKNLNDTIEVDDFEVSFKSFSQGQRQRAELAISFALFEVARIYFSNDSNLLILDEMDKGLDKFGVKAMINLLNGFDKQLKVFIVSHNPLMEEEIEDKIKIERDENKFSVIS